jgi:hypothetical protein
MRFLSSLAVAFAAGLAAAPAAAHPAWGIVVDGEGRVTFSEVSGNTVWRIAGREVVALVRHRHSHAIWQDAAGAVYGEDLAYDAPRDRWLTGFWRLDPAGRLEELLPLSDRPPAGAHPRLLGLAVMPEGGALVADYDHRVLREITPDGRVVDRWHGGLLWAPAGVAVSRGMVYLLEARPEQISVFLEALGPAVRVRRISADGTVTTLAAVGGRTMTWILLPVAAAIAGLAALRSLLRRRRPE